MNKAQLLHPLEVSVTTGSAYRTGNGHGISSLGNRVRCSAVMQPKLNAWEYYSHNKYLDSG